MNRRSFFKSLGLGAAAVAAQVYLPKLPDRMRWKTTRRGGIYVVNPEWVEAPYEVFFAFDPAMPEFDVSKVYPVIFKRRDFKPEEWAGTRFIHDPIPLRFKEIGGECPPPFKFIENNL